MSNITVRIDLEINAAFDRACILNGWSKSKKLSLLSELWGKSNGYDHRITSLMPGKPHFQLHVIVSSSFKKKCLENNLLFAEKMRNIIYVCLDDINLLSDRFSTSSSVTQIILKSNKNIIDLFSKKAKEEGFKPTELLLKWMRDYNHKFLTSKEIGNERSYDTIRNS